MNGTKLYTEAMDSTKSGVVGEHSEVGRRYIVRYAGRVGREDAGISNERQENNLPAVSLRFPDKG